MLKEDGFFLIDAIEKSIESGLTDKEIAKHIDKNFPSLLKKIKNLADKGTKIVLIKKVVFNELAKRLKAEGFNVINTEMLHFPSHRWQPNFREGLRKLLLIHQFNN